MPAPMTAFRSCSTAWPSVALLESKLINGPGGDGDRGRDGFEGTLPGLLKGETGVRLPLEPRAEPRGGVCAPESLLAWPDSASRKDCSPATLVLRRIVPAPENTPSGCIFGDPDIRF